MNIEHWGCNCQKGSLKCYTKEDLPKTPEWKEALNNNPGERRVRFSWTQDYQVIILVTQAAAAQVVSFILSHGRLHFSMW